MVRKLDELTIVSEFVSHWAPHIITIFSLLDNFAGFFPVSESDVAGIKNDKYLTRPPGLVILWLARSPGFLERDLKMTNIVHIAPRDSTTSIDQHCTSLGSWMTSLFQNPYYKKDLMSNPAW